MHTRRHRSRVFSVNVFVRVLIFLVASLPVKAISEPVSFGDVLQLPRAEVMQTPSYGNSPHNTVVNIRGSDQSRGAVTLIRGGCWSDAYDRNHTLPKAEALATVGYDVWVPEYRRVGDEGGGWPGSFEDIIAAVGFVTDKIEQQSILVGRSAGGHLALRAAQTGLAIDGVVGLAPISDLVSYGAESAGCQSMVAPFMGDSAYSPDESYRNTSVNLNAIAVSVALVIGKEDPIVGANQVAVLDAVQVPIVDGAGHFDVIHPKTEASSAVVTALEAIKKKVR